MRVADIMQTDVISVSPETTLAELDQLFMKHRISGVPVVSEDGELLGMVSKTDVIRSLSEEAARQGQGSPDMMVGEIMVPGITEADVDDDVVDVARTMLALQFHRVLVYREGKLAGIVTTFDMLRALVELGSPESSEPASGCSGTEGLP